MVEGFKNQSTWVLANAIDNDQFLHNLWLDEISDSIEASVDVENAVTLEEAIAFKLGLWLDNPFPIERQNVPAQFRFLMSQTDEIYSALLQGCLDEIDFQEVARHLIAKHKDIELSSNG